MDDKKIFELLTKFINNVFIPKDDQNNEDNSSDNRQIVEVNSSSSSTTVVISFLKQLCRMLKKKKISTTDLYFAFKDDYCKLNIVDDPCQIVAINQLTNQFRLLYDLMKVRLSVNDIIQNPGISESTPRYISDFKEVKLIASGSFGSVFKARHRLDGHEYAIKEICVSFEKCLKLMKILEEVKALAKLNHRNIVSYKNAWVEMGYSAVNKPTISNSSEDESPECSQNLDSHSCNESSSSSSPSPAPLIKGFKKFKIRDTHEPGCSTDVYINKNDDNNNSNSNNDSRRHKNKCTNNYTDHNGQELKPPVIVQKYLNDNSASYYNSTESIDSVVSFRNDCDDNDNSNSNNVNNIDNQDHWEDNNLSSGSPTSESDNEEPESDDTEKNNIEENNFNFEGSNSQQICEYNPRPDVLTLYIQMALCEQTLRKWLDDRNNTITPVLTVHEIFMQILMGLDYIHSLGMIHHDITPSNIFISTSNGIHVQIGDFGLACQTKESNGHPPFGTQMYAAPEQLAGYCDPKSDLYSLGIILLELLYPTITFMELDKILAGLKRGEIPDTLEQRYRKYAEVIMRLVVADPSQRPFASQLLKEFENNKDIAIDRLESQIRERNSDIELLFSLCMVLLNMVKKENNGTRRVKRLINDVKDKYKKK